MAHQYIDSTTGQTYRHHGSWFIYNVPVAVVEIEGVYISTYGRGAGAVVDYHSSFTEAEQSLYARANA